MMKDLNSTIWGTNFWAITQSDFLSWIPNIWTNEKPTELSLLRVIWCFLSRTYQKYNVMLKAVNTAIFVLNRVRLSRVGGKTPFELFKGQTGGRNKLHKWKTGYIFVGYSNNVDRFRIWMPHGNCIEVEL